MNTENIKNEGYSSSSATQSQLQSTIESNTRGTSTGANDDTKHYISPVSARSLASRHEGDYDPYQWQTPTFMKILQNARGEDVSFYTESSTFSCVDENVQRTVAIIKPEAMIYEDVIMRKIMESGFAVVQSRCIHLTPEQVSEIYAQHYGYPYFPHLVVTTSSGPARALSLAGLNAIKKWKNLIGPDKEIKAEWFYPISMRRRFGLVDSIVEMLHASENLRDSNFENRYLFPKRILEPLETFQDRIQDYLGLHVNKTLLDGLTEILRVMPIDPIIYLADWLLVNNPYQPNFSPDIARLPT